MAAMTSAAAILLAMLLAGRHEQTVGQEGTPIAVNTTVPANPEQDKVAAAPVQVTEQPEATADFPGIVPHSIAWRWRNGQGILTAAGTELSDDLLVRNDLPADRTTTSAAYMAATDAGLTNYKFVRRLLREAGVADDGRYGLISETVDTPGSR